MYTVQKDIDYLKALTNLEQIVDTDIFNRPIFGLIPSDINLDRTRETIKRLIGKYKFHTHQSIDGNVKRKILTVFIPEKVTNDKSIIGSNIIVTSKFIKEELQYVSIEIKKELKHKDTIFFHKST